MKCPKCGNKMKAKGPIDSSGTTRFKCSNSKCGVSVHKRSVPKPPKPLVWEG